MREEEWRKIQANYDKLVDELDLEHTTVVDYLYSKQVLGRHDKERLKSASLSKDRNELFLEILGKKGDDAYGHFLDALRLPDNQAHVAEYLQPPAPGRRLRNTSGAESGRHARKKLGDFSIQEIKDWLQPILEEKKIPRTVLEKIEEQQIDGRVFESMSEQDIRDVFPDLVFGHRRNLMLAKAEFAGTFQCTTDTELHKSKPTLQRTEFAREFGRVPEVAEKYYEGKILNKHEARGGNLLDPVRRFCPCINVVDVYNVIADEVVQFAAACLNGRVNGTIHFGISDQVYDDSDIEYGQVLGIALDKKECEDAIRLRIKRKFCGDTEIDAALKCIKPPVFVDVVLSDTSEEQNLFVCEVDVEPRSSVVETLSFFLKHEQEGREQELILFRFEAGVPVKQDARKVERFSAEKVLLTQERQVQETVVPSSSQRNILQTLKNYLCGGGDKLDGTICPLLATSAVDISCSEFQNRFSFLWHLDWRCIFDFHYSSDEKGLYSFLDKEKEMVYKIKRPSDFVISSTLAQQPSQNNPEEHFQDMADSELKPWIFCNGYTEGDEKGLSIAEWKRERSMGFREAVRFFRGIIPERRAIVVIVLTSKDDIFIEASEELLLNFEHQWLMIAESKQLADAWIDGLLKRNILVDRDRCLSGISFSDVSKAVKQLTGTEAFNDDACVIRMSTGLDKEIPKKMVQELCDLTIVSANECSAIEALSEKEISSLIKEKEDDFYKGNPATLWNFFAHTHVCVREKYPELLQYTRETLKGDVPDNAAIGCVAVYHQPGAGGTTIAMNVLWDLHKEFVCCTVKRVTNDTARQVVQLYEFAETNAPLLLMLDNEDDDKIDQLQRNIEELCQNKGIISVVCVFLLCLRRVILPQEHLLKNILLQQHLSRRELLFFTEKHEELKKSGAGNLDSLLGLNIMKENFNPEYIKRTVSSFLQVFQRTEEITLLKYIALLNCYDISFRSVPTSCFDSLMIRFPKRPGPNYWENTFTQQPLLRFTKNTKLSGKNKCLKVNNKLLCRYILDISLRDKKTIGELMEEFLNSSVVQKNSRDFAYKELINIVRDIMKKREWKEQGRRSTFSPFIQMLYDDKEYPQAEVCMEIVFQWTADPIVAQQLARFFISCKKWDEAEKWAEQATRIWPSNSYLWDTHGQICRFRLSEIREECEASPEPLSASKILETVTFAHKGFITFGNVQELSSHEKSVPPNTAGQFGQMDIALLLLKIFKCLPSFKSVDALQEFFSERQTAIPKELQENDLRDHIPWLKTLLEHASSCLQSVEYAAEVFQAEGYGQTSAKVFLSPTNLKRYKYQFSHVFGKETQLTGDPERMTPDSRRRLIKNLGGHYLTSVVSLCREPGGRESVEKILLLSSLNLKQHKSPHGNFDLSLALSSALTLCSIHDHAQKMKLDFCDLLVWSQEYFQQKKDSQYLELDPSLFLLVFHWPTPQGQQPAQQCDSALLFKAMNLAAENFKKKFSGDTSRSKNKPLYFLTKKGGLSKVVFTDQLKMWSGKDSRYRAVSRMLQSHKAMEVLHRFSGTLVKNGNEVELKLSKDQHEKQRIRLFTRENNPRLWNKKVFFVLSFGLGGPLACDVRDEWPPSHQARQAEMPPEAFVPPTLRAPPVMEHDEEIENIGHRIRTIQYLQRKSNQTQKEEQMVRELPQLQKRIRKLQEQRHRSMLPHI